MTKNEGEEEQLKNPTQSFRVVLRAIPDPVFILNEEGVFEDVNTVAVQRLGFTKEEIVGTSLWNNPFFPEETVEKTTKNFTRRKQGEYVSPYTVKLKTKKGKPIFVEVNVGTLEENGFEGEIVIARDITERKKKEEQRIKAEKRFRSVVENANDGIYIREKDGTITYANQKFADLYGYPLEEIIGKKSWAFIHPDTLHELREENTFAKIREGHPQRFELKIQTKSGKIKYLDCNTVSLTQKGAYKVMGIVRDITERKRMEKDLKRYKLTVEASKDLIAAVNEEYVYLFANETFLHYHQLERGQVVGHTVPEVVGEKMFKEKIKPYLDQCLQGENIQYERTHRYPDLGTRHLEVQYYPLPSENGKTKSIVANIRDITEQIEQKEKLATLHRWAQRLNNANSKEEIFKFTLDAIEQTLGFKYAAIQVKQGTFLKIVASRGFPEIPQKIQKLPLEGKGITVKAARSGKTIFINNVDNHPDYHRVAPSFKSELAVPIKRENHIFGVLNVESEEQAGFDKQDQQLLETLASHVAVAIKELREKQKRVSLKRIDELRTQFLGMAAHEINTPLTPIKTNLEMLQREYLGKLNEKQQSRITQTLESVERLTRLVNDFRRATKLRAAQIELNKKEHQLADTVEKALEKYKNVIVEEDITLVKQFEQPLTAVYDEDRMIQVFRNLVENAIDYTENKIWIHGSLHEDRIHISVRDNGSGIPEAEQDKIFQAFYRVEDEGRSRENRQFGGTGLGLNICKRIVEAHEGSIQVESSLGKGSTFIVTFPIHGGEKEVQQYGG